MAFKSYHCVSVRNRFPLKLDVIPKNIILHNVMCETHWIAIRTQCVPFRPAAILVLNWNDMTSLLASALNTDSAVSGLHSSIGRKGYSLQGYTRWMTEIR